MLLVELEGSSQLVAPLEAPALGYEIAPIEVGDLLGADAGELSGCKITPEAALADYLEHSGLSHLGRRLATSGAVEVLAAAAPGIRDLLMLGKIRQLAERDVADLIVVDAPAAGHAVTFLEAAAGMAATAPSGPVRHQADQVLEMLGDDARCQVLLVTLAEETPVNEVVDTAFALEDRVGVKLGPVVLNGLWPALRGLAEAAAGGTEAERELARYRLQRIDAQVEQADRLRSELPLPVVELPFLFTAQLDRAGIGQLAAELTAGIDRVTDVVAR